MHHNIDPNMMAMPATPASSYGTAATVALVGDDEAVQTESGSGDSNEREDVEREIVSTPPALSDEATMTSGQLQARVTKDPGSGEIQIDGLSDDDLEQFRRIAAERGMTVEELAQAIGDQVEQSARSWLGDLWKEYFAGLRLMFKRSGSKPAPVIDEDPGQSPHTST